MIYLDNSATTYPKPPQVRSACSEALLSYSFNPGRGGYRQSVAAAEKVYSARKTVKEFFHAPCEESVIFTPGCTQSLNMAIKGVLRQGDHAVISSFEHNSVVRPLHKLQKEGKITYSVAAVVPGDDEATIENFRRAINGRTRLIICTHASNAFGVRLPAERLCALAHSYGILFCLDAAQSAGILPIDMERDGYDFVCCAGHKYLYGPTGIGLLLLGRDDLIETLTEGGTGSNSSDPEMPSFYPDRLEAGTVNIPGILGLEAGIRFVSGIGVERICKKEMRLIRILHEQLRTFRKIRVYGGCDPDSYVPVLSFTVSDTDSETAAKRLSEQYGIAVRGGLHCAPLAHQSMGTIDTGTIRVAPSYYTTENEIRVLLNSLRKFR